MSTPVENNDNDELKLYAPKWARDQVPRPPKDSGPELRLVETAASELKLASTERAPRQAPSLWPEGEAADSNADRPPSMPEAPDTKARSRMPPGIGGPNLDWAPRLRTKQSAPEGIDGLDMDWPQPSQRTPAFEGDLAVKAMRERLSLEPDVVPGPPVRRKPKTIMPSLARLSLVVVVAAVVAYGITLVSLSGVRPISSKREGDSAVRPAQTAALVRAPTHLVVEGRQTFANEALPLGIAMKGASGGEFALLTGLAAGTHLSVGGPFGATGWRVAANDLGKALAYAPKDFIGVMEAAIDLRTPNDTLVDRQLMRLEWISKAEAKSLDIKPLEAKSADLKSPELNAPDPKSADPKSVRQDRDGSRPVVAPLDPEEVAALVRRGMAYLQIGDIASARLALSRAAGAGNSQAAMTLGATYDPQVLAELGVLGFAPDPKKARAWYQRAAELGSSEAERRLNRLAQAGN